MVPYVRGAILARTIYCRPHVIGSKPLFQQAPVAILLRRGYASDKSTGADTSGDSEGPQSKEKTERAKDKIENDPRMKDVDDLIRDKYALIRDEEYRTPNVVRAVLLRKQSDE